MKTAHVRIETVSFWCPDCNGFYEDPEYGSSFLDGNTVEDMPSVLECKDCGTKFRKPRVTLERNRKSSTKA